MIPLGPLLSYVTCQMPPGGGVPATSSSLVTLDSTGVSVPPRYEPSNDGRVKPLIGTDCGCNEPCITFASVPIENAWFGVTRYQTGGVWVPASMTVTRPHGDWIGPQVASTL